LRRYERSHLWYGRRFEAQVREGHEAFLRFEGVDCFAEIYLNGHHIGSCANMLIEHEFRVDEFLQADNELLIHLRPAFDEAKNSITAESARRPASL
jgi:beta-mannosidase